MPDAEDIESVVRVILIEELGVTSEELRPDADILDDLGADSLDIAEIALLLEEKLPIEITDDDFEQSGVKTVQQLIYFVKGKLDLQQAAEAVEKKGEPSP